MKKSKFKVGDRVEVISGNRKKLIGKTGVVVKVREDCVEIMLALSWFPISEEDLRIVNKMTKEKRPLCPYCDQPIDDIAIENLSISAGCDTCGFGASASGTIVVSCSACKKVIYKKEWEGE